MYLVMRVDNRLGWEDCYVPNRYNTLFGCMERYISNGEETELLDVIHKTSAAGRPLSTVTRSMDAWEKHLLERDDEEDPA